MYMRLGFDTASSIALLAVSALAKRGPDGRRIPPADIVILPVRNLILWIRIALSLAYEVLIYSRDDIRRFRGRYLDAILLFWIP